jgi:hypothetical protein
MCAYGLQRLAMRLYVFDDWPLSSHPPTCARELGGDVGAVGGWLSYGQ